MTFGELLIGLFSAVALGTVVAGLLGFLGDDDELDY